MFFGQLPTQAESQNVQLIDKETTWEKLRFEEIKELSAHIKAAHNAGAGLYPYLFELFEHNGDESTYELCDLLSSVMQQIKTPVQNKGSVTPAKSSLKQKDYVINYNAKLHAKVKREALRPVTRRDLEERHEYIANQIKVGNEAFERERQSFTQDPQPEKERRVKLSDVPDCIQLISPHQIMKNGAFTRNAST